jgi:hypothetical protein
MKTAEECEEVSYPATHRSGARVNQICLVAMQFFVSSPVRFRPLAASRFTLLTCPHTSCSLHGQPTRYLEEEIGFQDGYVFRKPCSEFELKR